MAGDEQLMQQYSHLLAMIAWMQECAALDPTDGVMIWVRSTLIRRSPRSLLMNRANRRMSCLRERGESERIIEDFMICGQRMCGRPSEMDGSYRRYTVCMNSRSRRRCAHLPALPKRWDIRLSSISANVHATQFQKLLEEAKGEDNYDVLSTYMLRSMQKARYDAQCLGHFGLGLQEYLHFTSPIRRYPDLVVHRMLRTLCLR